MFMDTFEHCWDPTEYSCDPNEKKDRSEKKWVCSEVYHEYTRKLDADGGVPRLCITDKQFEKYFSRKYSEDQRFAVLFGMWWGLKPEQISRLSNLRQEKYCWEWLDLFLRSSIWESGGSIMFEAFSEKQYRILCANEVRDFSEVFRCPNPDCTARFKAVCRSGKSAAYFAQLPGAPHIEGCEFKYASIKYQDQPGMKKVPVEDIYANSR